MIGIPAGLEWVIILLIVVILFGVGRLGKIGGELGNAIRQFREGLQGEEKKNDQPAESKDPNKPSA